jgi:hypothetical protein
MSLFVVPQVHQDAGRVDAQWSGLEGGAREGGARGGP